MGIERQSRSDVFSKTVPSDVASQRDDFIDVGDVGQAAWCISHWRARDRRKRLTTHDRIFIRETGKANRR